MVAISGLEIMCNLGHGTFVGKRCYDIYLLSIDPSNWVSDVSESNRNLKLYE